MYVLLQHNRVAELIPDEDPIFPGVPIHARYSPGFINKLLYVADDTEVAQNWIYDTETEAFMEKPPEVITNAE